MSLSCLQNSTLQRVLHNCAYGQMENHHKHSTNPWTQAHQPHQDDKKHSFHSPVLFLANCVFLLCFKTAIPVSSLNQHHLTYLKQVTEKLHHKCHECTVGMQLMRNSAVNEKAHNYPVWTTQFSSVLNDHDAMESESYFVLLKKIQLPAATELEELSLQLDLQA